MKTGTKLLLAGGAALVVGAIAYRNGANNLQFYIDGFDMQPGTTNIIVRIKVVNPNRFFGYPVPVVTAYATDSNQIYLGTIHNTQLQYIPANATSFIYGIVQANFGVLATIIMNAINGNVPTGLTFTGVVTLGNFKIPFSTNQSIGGIHSVREHTHEENSDFASLVLNKRTQLV